MALTTWNAADLDAIARADELRIAVRRRDGSLRPPVPIWVVVVDGGVYVRTWHRRESGWFGRVLRSRQARIDVPGVTLDVDVEDVGAGPAAVRAGVDEAYRRKYARYGAATLDRMVGAEAAAATLLLTPHTDPVAPAP